MLELIYQEMNLFEDEIIIKNKKQDICWAMGDKNTNQGFSMWRLSSMKKN